MINIHKRNAMTKHTKVDIHVCCFENFIRQGHIRKNNSKNHGQNQNSRLFLLYFEEKYGIMNFAYSKKNN